MAIGGNARGLIDIIDSDERPRHDEMEVMMKLSLTPIATALALVAVSPILAHAAPVQYVRICDTNKFGDGYYYIPYTDVCFNANDGTTKQDTGNGIRNAESEMAARFNDAFEGVSVSAALPEPFIPQGQKFAVAGSWGHFEGGTSGSAGLDFGSYSAGSADALGLGAAVRVNNNLTFNASGAVGLRRGTWVTKAGFNASW